MFGVYERCLRDVWGVVESIFCERFLNFLRDLNFNDYRVMYELFFMWNVVGMICDLVLICLILLWMNLCVECFLDFKVLFL